MQTYRKYVWKICSIKRETNIGQGGWILCGIQRAAGRQYWQKEDMWMLRTDIAADRSFPQEWQWYWAHFFSIAFFG